MVSGRVAFPGRSDWSAGERKTLAGRALRRIIKTRSKVPADTLPAPSPAPPRRICDLRAPSPRRGEGIVGRPSEFCDRLGRRNRLCGRAGDDFPPLNRDGTLMHSLTGTGRSARRVRWSLGMWLFRYFENR